MDGFWDWVWVAVVAGLIVAAILAVTRWTWQRRRKPADWANAGTERLNQRSLDQATKRHAELVGHVLKRSEVLGVEVPLKVTGSNPAVVEYHPTGRRFGMYRDLPSYKAAGERREHSGHNAHFGKAPRPIHLWTVDQLQKWLTDHAHHSPESG